MSEPTNPRRVAVYRRDMSAFSESFITAQANALRRWEPWMLVDRPPRPTLPMRASSLAGDGWLSGIQQRTARLLHIADPAGKRRLGAIRPDLVHAHFGTGAVDIWPLVRASGIPMLVTLHGYDINTRKDWWRSGNGGWRRRRYPHDLLALAGSPSVSFIAISRAIEDAAIRFGIPEAKLTRAYIGVDTGLFKPGPVPIEARPPQVLFVGRLVENKGPHVVLEAFKRLSARVPAAELVILGDGPMRQPLEAAASGFRVRFVGGAPGDVVRAEMAGARVLCQPSLTTCNGASEGFGLAILEAQASGIPVVSSARGGSLEGMRHGMTGYRFDEGAADQAADFLERILVDDSLARSMSAAARNFAVDNFDIADCTQRLELAYDAACATKEGRC